MAIREASHPDAVIRADACATEVGQERSFGRENSCDQTGQSQCRIVTI
jgi:hypothetical protein